jgi:import inner membrane translocase subunit TIM13
MDFSGSSAPKGSLNPNERAALISNVKEQLAMANAQEILQQISEKCFKLCIQKPGSSLSSSEQV